MSTTISYKGLRNLIHPYSPIGLKWKPEILYSITLIALGILIVLGQSNGHALSIYNNADYIWSISHIHKQKSDISGYLSDEFNNIGEDQEFSHYSNLTSAKNNSSNILLISLDGFSRQRFNEYKNNLTNFNSLENEKWIQLNVTNLVYITQTRNGHATMLSGYLGNLTGVFSNKQVYNPLPVGYTFLEKAETELEPDKIATAFISGKYKNMYPAFNKTALATLDYVHIQEEYPNQTINHCLDFLDKYGNTRFAAFFHFRDPDKTAHLFTEGSKEWENSLMDVDHQLGLIISKLQELGVYNNTLIYLTTDHGFMIKGTSHKHEPYIWLYTNDESLEANVKNPLIGVQDIAPTICYSLNLTYDFQDIKLGQPLQLALPEQKLDYRKIYFNDTSFPEIHLQGYRFTVLNLQINVNVSSDVDQLILFSDSDDYSASLISKTSIPLGTNTVTINVGRNIYQHFNTIYLLAYDVSEKPTDLLTIDYN